MEISFLMTWTLERPVPATANLASPDFVVIVSGLVVTVSSESSAYHALTPTHQTEHQVPMEHSSRGG